MQAAPAEPGDVQQSRRSRRASLQVTGLTVENGAAERSYVRDPDVDFNESDAQSSGKLTAWPARWARRRALQVRPATTTHRADRGALSGVDSDGDRPRHRAGLRRGRLGGGRTRRRRRLLRAGHHGGGMTYKHYFYRLLGDVTGDGVVDGATCRRRARAVPLLAGGLHTAERRRQRRRVGHDHRLASRQAVQGARDLSRSGGRLRQCRSFVRTRQTLDLYRYVARELSPGPSETSTTDAVASTGFPSALPKGRPVFESPSASPREISFRPTPGPSPLGDDCPPEDPTGSGIRLTASASGPNIVTNSIPPRERRFGHNPRTSHSTCTEPASQSGLGEPAVGIRRGETRGAGRGMVLGRPKPR